jgi:tetratricopeptide (TPR) repeat protein
MQKKNNNGIMLEAFQKSLECAKNEREKKFVHHNLGYYYRKIEDYIEALNHFRNALNIDKSFQLSI